MRALTRRVKHCLFPFCLLLAVLLSFGASASPPHSTPKRVPVIHLSGKRGHNHRGCGQTIQVIRNSARR